MPASSREKAPATTDGRAPATRREIPVVEFRDVTKVYEGGSVGLEKVSMRIGRGEFVFLVGPTGCGKSTCVRLLMKELDPDEGEILISGHELGSMPRKKVPKLRRNVGVVFQDFKLLPNRTVYDNVAYSLEVIGESRQAIRRKVPTSCGWSACPRSCTTTPTSSRAASSSACRSPARS
jgi:cell division transport system ATP-binding protein